MANLALETSTKRRSRGLLLPAGLMILGLVAGAGPASAAQGTLALLPATSVVAPLEVFDLELTAAAGTDSFNAYDVMIEFDPSRLTFIQLAPISQQEGPLMTSACGSRFHVFDETAGDISITHSLLCAGVRVTGPGVVYRLRFQAGADVGPTTVAFTNARMFSAGIPFTSVTTEDAEIQIGSISGIGEGSSLGGVLSPPYPNPARGPVRFSIHEPAASPVTLRIFSVDGSPVRTLLEHAGGVTEVLWDRRDDRGLQVAPGVYFVRLLRTAETETRRIVLLDP